MPDAIFDAEIAAPAAIFELSIPFFRCEYEH
jgi:hypothetical protein